MYLLDCTRIHQIRLVKRQTCYVALVDYAKLKEYAEVQVSIDTAVVPTRGCLLSGGELNASPAPHLNTYSPRANASRWS